MIRFLISFLLASLIFLSISLPAYAISDPDSLQVLSIFAYKSVIETDDTLFLVKYRIEYASLPTELVSETFLGRFLDSTGTTELNSTTPYPFNDKGYGEGVFSFYFSAADVISQSITWEGSFTVRLQGNPSLFASPPLVDSGSIIYRSDIATKFHLRNDLVNIAVELEVAWVANDVDLVSAQPEGNLLTSDGDEYFTNSINDLRLMVPDLFSSRVQTPRFEERDFDQSFSESLRDFWQGTEIDTMIQDGADTLDMPKMVFSTILLLAATSFIAFLALKSTGRSEFALLMFAFMLPIGALIGLTEMVFAALMAAMSTLGVAYVFFFRHV